MSPEVVVAQLRAMRAHLGEMAPLTIGQRQALGNRARTSNPILQASINVIGALDNVSLAIGQPADEVRQMYDDANRWTAVEDELRTMLSGVSGANLVRRQRIALIAAQAFNIGSQLARDPANAALVPHVEEIKRLKSFKRRKKASQVPAPGTPAPAASELPPLPEQESQAPVASVSQQP
jgi:hypothetical protein